MIDKEKAIQLRKAGKTYKEIAIELNCSEIWCKTNLKGVSKDENFSEAVEECISISKQPNGITPTEILKIVEIFQQNPEFWKKSMQESENRKKILKNIKKKVKISGGVVRPSWMVPDDSRAAFEAMLRLVNAIDDCIYEHILEFRKEFNLDSSHDKSILGTIAQLSQIGALTYGSSGVSAICESYEKSADLLASIRTEPLQSITKSVQGYSAEDFDDLEPEMY